MPDAATVEQVNQAGVPDQAPSAAQAGEPRSGAWRLALGRNPRRGETACTGVWFGLAPMLERVALHQTRLRVPGVGLDARGVALGLRGLVLLPSLDRLVAFLAVYTETQTLEPVLDSLRIEVVRSKLNTREVVLGIDAGSSDRMDRVAEVARLVGGYTFTGTNRHFVQYRDSAAPFGYDVRELVATDSSLAFYHSTFSQTYDVERTVELASLLLALEPRAEPASGVIGPEIYVVTEIGVGPGLVRHLRRSGVRARAGLIDWNEASSGVAGRTTKWLLAVTGLPERLVPMFTRTPGLTTFIPQGPSVGVEYGFRHPVALTACPVFATGGLTLFRGRGTPPLSVARLPVLADVRSLERVRVQAPAALPPAQGRDAAPMDVPVRLVPRLSSIAACSAAWLPPEEFPLLRKLAYALPANLLVQTRVAFTERGAILMNERGLDGVPLGRLYRRVHRSIFVPVGLEISPAVDGEVLFTALGAPPGTFLFFENDASVTGVEERAFGSLSSGLIEPEKWTPVRTTEIEALDSVPASAIWLEPLGVLPMRGVKLA